MQLKEQILMETRKGQGRKASHGLRTVWSPLNWFHPLTYAEKRLQQMVLDLDVKYDALSRTMDQKRDGKDSLVDNLFQHKESIFTEEVSNFDLPGRFKVPEISLFSGSEVKIQWSTWIISGLTCPCTRHLTLWRAELFPSPCQERLDTGSESFPQGQLIILIPLEGSS